MTTWSLIILPDPLNPFDKAVLGCVEFDEMSQTQDE